MRLGCNSVYLALLDKSNVVEFSYSYRVKFKSEKRKKKSSSFIQGLQKSSHWVVVVQWTSKKYTKQVFFTCKDGVLFITPWFVLRSRGSRRRGILSSLFFSTEFHLSACLCLHSLTVLCMVDISLKPHYQLRIVLVCL